jgi:hypothetical protein
MRGLRHIRTISSQLSAPSLLFLELLLVETFVFDCSSLGCKVQDVSLPLNLGAPVVHLVLNVVSSPQYYDR